MSLSRRSLLASALCVLMPPVALADDATASMLERVAKARSTMTTMRGPFVQTRTIGLLATDVRSHGSMVLSRPSRLRWELQPPDAVIFWVGPEGLSYRSTHGSGRLPEATGRVAAALEDMRLLIGGDVQALARRWALRLVSDTPDGPDIEAIARVPGAAFVRSMRFSLAPDLVRPQKAVLVEGPHDRTVIEFGKIEVNVPVDEATMRGG